MTPQEKELRKKLRALERQYDRVADAQRGARTPASFTKLQKIGQEIDAVTKELAKLAGAA